MALTAVSGGGELTGKQIANKQTTHRELDEEGAPHRMTLIDQSAEATPPIQRFVVHSPLVAMKSLGRKNLVMLDKRTTGDIVETYGDHSRPGLVMVAVEKELFLIWRRDLEERAELLPA